MGLWNLYYVKHNYCCMRLFPNIFKNFYDLIFVGSIFPHKVLVTMEWNFYLIKCGLAYELRVSLGWIGLDSLAGIVFPLKIKNTWDFSTATAKYTKFNGWDIMSDDYVKFVNINIGRCTRKCYRQSNSNRTESSGKNLVTNKDIQSSQREDLPLLLGIAQITPTPHP